MVRSITPIVLSLLLSFIFAQNSLASLMTTVEIGRYNESMLFDYGVKPPSSYAGIPFSFPNSYYDAYVMHDHGTYDIPTEIYSPNVAYLLLSTGWGVPGFHSGDVVFTTNDKQTYTLNLTNNYNIRNWQYDPAFSNNLSAPNARQVWSKYPTVWHQTGWMDMLTVTLPSSFQGHWLEDIRFIDYGRVNYSAVFIKGITVDHAATPEPSTFLFGALGLLSLVLVRQRIFK